MRFSSKTFKRATLNLSRLRGQKRSKTRRNLKALKKQQLKKQRGGAFGVEVPTNAIKVNPLKTDIDSSISDDI